MERYSISNAVYKPTYVDNKCIGGTYDLAIIDRFTHNYLHIWLHDDSATGESTLHAEGKGKRPLEPFHATATKVITRGHLRLLLQKAGLPFTVKLGEGDIYKSLLCQVADMRPPRKGRHGPSLLERIAKEDMH